MGSVGQGGGVGTPDAARRVDVRGLRAVADLPEPQRSWVVRHDGVATTALLAAAGVTDTVVSRRVRTGQWRRLHRGVVLLQSGAPTWRQVAQGAVAVSGRGAALSHRSAAFAHGLVTSPGPSLVVSVPAGRTVGRRAGLVVRRRPVVPPSAGSLRCVGVADTVLDVVSDATDDDEVVRLLCDAVRGGVARGRLLDVLGTRPALRHRRLVGTLLADVDQRVESPLELRYDRDVERAHGLPTSHAQVREVVAGDWIRADRRFPTYGVRVELDGRLAHAGRVDADVWRDNAVLLERADLTLRYRWHHVVATPCAVAAQIATALRAGGWPRTPTRCGPRCRS